MAYPVPTDWTVCGTLNKNGVPFSAGKVYADNLKNGEFQQIAETGISANGSFILTFSRANFQNGDNSLEFPTIRIRVEDYQRNTLWTSNIYNEPSAALNIGPIDISKHPDQNGDCRIFGTVEIHTPDTSLSWNYFVDTYNKTDLVVSGIVGKNYGLIENVSTNGFVFTKVSDAPPNDGRTAELKTYQGGIVAKNFKTGIVKKSVSKAVLNDLKRIAIRNYYNDTLFSGGICGYNAGTLHEVSAESDSLLFLATYAGGVVGYNNGNINRAYNNVGIIKTNSKYIGGIAGYADSTSVIKNSYNKGHIKKV